jgi:hypothetical protein
MSQFDLDGIDGSNPIGFLAAVGTLAAVQRETDANTSRLSWRVKNGTWRPCLHLNRTLTQAELLDVIEHSLRTLAGHPAFSLADNLNIDCSDFRAATRDAQTTASPAQRKYADFLASFGCESVESSPGGKPTGKIADTAFRTMSGSGHQHFLGSMRTFIRDTTQAHLANALFETWRYDDTVEKHTMRWDPVDDVRYALRWRNPSGDPERKHGGSVWGANRLAIEALPLFPTMPARGLLRTTGFTERKRHGVFWTWPIWTGRLNADTVRSVLSLAQLQDEHPDRSRLLHQGIVEVFRCQRITQGKFRNFGAARPT